MTLDVSVVVCCHNSAKRLPQTLAHLAAQQVRKGLEWEVIVIDNASRDQTGQVALASWPANAPAPLRVVYESRLGLTHARHRGLAEAKYELISFVDDDNWVCPEWVQLVSEVMSQHPDVGACGGIVDGVCEADPPSWFAGYRSSYAVGPQAREAGDITWTRGFLWGAGLSIRKSAWQELVGRGFRPLLTDRRGRTLRAGGDSELCFALRLAGWRLWYEPRLRLQHVLPAHRLKWNYLRRMHRGFGASSVEFDPYLRAQRGNYENISEGPKYTWQRESIEVLKTLLQYRHKLLGLLYYPLEGDPDVLFIERLLGRLSELLRRRRAYDLSFREIWEAPWRRVSCLDDGITSDGRRHHSAAVGVTATATRVAIDLTPILPGGENGGAKIVAIELIRNLSRHAPDWEFALLTSERTHDELSILDASNVWRLCVARHGSDSRSQPLLLGRLNHRLKERIAVVLPPRLRARLKKIYHSKRRTRRSMVSALMQASPVRSIFADLLFCPMTAPFYFDPSVPTVCVLYDLQYLYYPQFFRPDDRKQRDKNFRDACHLADRLICLSDYVRGTVLQNANVNPANVVTLRPHLFHRLKRSSPETVAHVLDRLALRAGRFLFYPANFWAHKNHCLLLTAFGIYRARHSESDLKLVCAGAPNAHMEQLCEAAQRMGLAEWIVFPGFMVGDELAALLESCRAIIFPSLYEGFGVPILEAMAFGKPVLCSNVTSVPEVAADAALFFDPAKPMEIENAIERIEEDDELVANLIERGHKRLADFGSAREMARQLLQIFQEVMSCRVEFGHELHGIYDDGWTGARTVITYGASAEERSLEIVLEASLGLPFERVSVTVTQAEGLRLATYTIDRGERATIRHALPHHGGFIELLFKPVFQPKAHGMNDDDRMLGCICLACRLVSPTQTIDLLWRGGLIQHGS